MTMTGDITTQLESLSVGDCKRFETPTKEFTGEVVNPDSEFGVKIKPLGNGMIAEYSISKTGSHTVYEVRDRQDQHEYEEIDVGPLKNISEGV